MSTESVIIIFILGVFVLGVLIRAIVIECRKPKWLKIYIYTKESMDDRDEDVDYDETIAIYQSLKTTFKLSEEEATEAIQNCNNEEWFRNKFWTK